MQCDALFLWFFFMWAVFIGMALGIGFVRSWDAMIEDAVNGLKEKLGNIQEDLDNLRSED